MNRPPGKDTQGSRLDRIIAEYLKDAETGRAPDREKWLRKYPELADDLKEFWRDQDRLDGMLDKGKDTTRKSPPDKYRAGTIRMVIAPALSPRPASGFVRRFGDYELCEEIARGGMGIVFRARQLSLNRTVALKMLLAGSFACDEDVRRFKIEARAAGRLDHPNIVAIHEVGEHDGRQYFTMRLVEGGSLEPVRDPAAIDLRGVVRLMISIAKAVDYAHGHGILHRDLKPANILLDAHGQPQITDFGLAKHADEDSGLTRSGEVMGTAYYMAPEQAAGGSKRITAASDIYSLGAILYELITGAPPFDAPTPMAILIKVQNEEPLQPRQLNKRIDRDLETVCLKCLEKKPERRYASAQALAADLEAWLAGRPIRARPVTPWERAVKWARRHPPHVAAFGMAMVMALTIAAALNQRYQTTDPQTAAGKRFGPRASSLDIADALLEKGRLDMAREMYEAAREEAETPQAAQAAEEGLRKIRMREFRGIRPGFQALEEMF